MKGARLHSDSPTIAHSWFEGRECQFADTEGGIAGEKASNNPVPEHSEGSRSKRSPKVTVGVNARFIHCNVCTTLWAGLIVEEAMNVWEQRV